MGDKYDVVIIGAGIGGLVCGCYLAKAGLKVLIVEQHDKPGGYCTSFTRKGYRFDVGVHYLGGLKRGVLGKILGELDVKDSLNCKQFDVTDKIIVPGNISVCLRPDPSDTINEFKKTFPHESSAIDKFFTMALRDDFIETHRQTKRAIFQDILNGLFKDEKIKHAISALLFNVGTNPEKAAAFPMMVLLRQYVLDPGYYPQGGMQKLPDSLAAAFTTAGGELWLQQKVERIITEGGRAFAVSLKDGKKIFAKNVVSNADAVATFSKLLDINTREQGQAAGMKTAPSLFILYLALKNKPSSIGAYNTYLLLDDDNRRLFLDDLDNNKLRRPVWISLSYQPSEDTAGSAIALTFAPYAPDDFWKHNKREFMDEMLKACRKIDASIDENVKFKFCATPRTLKRYTGNTRGAFCGWASVPEQMALNLLPQKTSVENLYLAGHWCTTGYLPFGGIPSVAYIGRNAARRILRDSGVRCALKDILV